MALSCITKSIDFNSRKFINEINLLNMSLLLVNK